MATEFNLVGLITPLNAMTGFQEALTDLKLMALLRAGMFKFNADLPNTRTFVSPTMLDDTPTKDEQMYLILAAVHAHLMGRMVETSEQAIVVSNVAGRTDLAGIELAMAKRRTEVEKMMERLAERLRDVAVVSEVAQNELGETLDVAEIQILYPSWWGPVWA